MALQLKREVNLNRLIAQWSVPLAILQLTDTIKLAHHLTATGLYHCRLPKSGKLFVRPNNHPITVETIIDAIKYHSPSGEWVKLRPHLVN